MSYSIFYEWTKIGDQYPYRKETSRIAEISDAHRDAIQAWCDKAASGTIRKASIWGGGKTESYWTR